MNAAAHSAAREVEAILLVSGRPVPSRALAAATERTREEVEEAVSILEERYSPENSGVVLRRVGGGFQFATNPETSGAVERFRREARPSPLSAAAHEVLACVLYLGPMTRGAVSKVRGVNSDAVARSLIERGLLAESGFDSEAPGSPALLDLTEEFHIASGSSTRADFPPLDSLVNESELDRVRERIVAPTGESAPEDAAPGEIATGDVAPDKPGEASPEKAASRRVASDETPSGGHPPETSASDENMAGGAAPREAVPREAAPGDSAPEARDPGGYSPDSGSETTASFEPDSDAPAPGGESPEETAPGRPEL
ncbi:MAG: SMC-Scp complex subunit ScpB [Rubrobacter sp.]|nr:SMC-Scp complex subunit ScpB [Rubrobacter sp.]